MANSFDLMNKQARVLQALRNAAGIMGNDAVNYFQGSFRRQGWEGKPWQKRKANAKRNKGRGILINTGRLKNSIRITKQSGLTVAIGTDVPYAQVHNEGGEITSHARSELFTRNRGKSGRFKKGTKAGQGFSYKGGTRKMPQRQFMGSSATLTKQLQKTLNQQLANAFK